MMETYETYGNLRKPPRRFLAGFRQVSGRFPAGFRIFFINRKIRKPASAEVSGQSIIDRPHGIPIYLDMDLKYETYSGPQYVLLPLP